MNDSAADVSRHVTTAWQDGVATLTIDRPPVNALSMGLLRELLAVVEQLAVESALRCVVVTGAGDKCFVAGADVHEAAATPPEKAPERTAVGQELMLALENLPVPVIVAINGLCLGGGCELALAGDIRIAAEHARFGQPEINLGIIPGFGGTQRLPRLIGQGAAMDLILTGRDISAAEAQQLGLVSRVVAGPQLLDSAMAVATRLAALSPEALAADKRAIRAASELPLAPGLSLESDLSAQVRRTPNAIEGLSAFTQKRPPRFS